MPNWAEILVEMQETSQLPPPHPVDIVRRKYLGLLHKKTGRNIIAYYSAWLQGRSDSVLCSIDDADKNAFMTAIHEIDPSKGLDLILHTPGGGISATESLVGYLREKFGTNIRAIIPQLAMSAGTMIACSCKKIVMGKQSSIGPIDPQYRGIPCEGVLREFETAVSESRKDPACIPMWRAIIEKYHPTFLGQCKLAIDMSREMVIKWLETGMFSGKEDSTQKAKEIVDKLRDTESTKMHERHLDHRFCEEIGLEIEMMEDDQELQDLILSVHHSFMHSMGVNSATYKIVENHLGRAMFINGPQRL